MGDVILFSAFGFVPAPKVSLRLPWARSRLALQAASGRRLTCVSVYTRSRLKASLSYSNLSGTNHKVARNEFIEPTL